MDFLYIKTSSSISSYINSTLCVRKEVGSVSGGTRGLLVNHEMVIIKICKKNNYNRNCKPIPISNSYPESEWDMNVNYIWWSPQTSLNFTSCFLTFFGQLDNRVLTPNSDNGPQKVNKASVKLTAVTPKGRVLMYN